MSADSRKVVLVALAGNVAIALCKLAAALASRSTATMAEAVHSFVDTGNQGLLLVGMSLAARPADAHFSFGRAAERYFWPFVVALLLFSVGGAFAIFDGVLNLVHPPTEPGSRMGSFIVLGVSLVMEGTSFTVAWREFRKHSGGRPLRRALIEARDPTIPLVLAEDTAAIAGLVLALVAIGLSQATGQHFWDPIGGVFIGVLLCSVALVLAWITHGLLIGVSATPEDQARVTDLARSVDGVDAVTQVLTLHLGPDVVLLALKIAFRPTLTVSDVEDVTNRIERTLREAMPHMRKIFIEADSRGDMRGVAS